MTIAPAAGLLSGTQDQDVAPSQPAATSLIEIDAFGARITLHGEIDVRQPRTVLDTLARPRLTEPMVAFVRRAVARRAREHSRVQRSGLVVGGVLGIVRSEVSSQRGLANDRGDEPARVFPLGRSRAHLDVGSAGMMDFDRRQAGIQHGMLASSGSEARLAGPEQQSFGRGEAQRSARSARECQQHAQDRSATRHLPTQLSGRNWPVSLATNGCFVDAKTRRRSIRSSGGFGEV